VPTQDHRALMTLMLYIAGHETTVNLIAGGARLPVLAR
jgi:cytochrome P450